MNSYQNSPSGETKSCLRKKKEGKKKEDQRKEDQRKEDKACYQALPNLFLEVLCFCFLFWRFYVFCFLFWRFYAFGLSHCFFVLFRFYCFFCFIPFFLFIPLLPISGYSFASFLYYSPSGAFKTALCHFADSFT